MHGENLIFLRIDPKTCGGQCTYRILMLVEDNLKWIFEK
jgi:hypothetical protein